MRNRLAHVRVVGGFVLAGALVAGCGREPTERIREIERLAESPGADNARRIGRYLEDRDPSVRAAAISRWVPAVGEGGRPEVILRLLEDPDGLVRSTAARRLGEVRAQVAPDLLRHLRADTDWRVRQRCAEALGSLGSAEAVEGLAQASIEPEATVRGAAIRALAAAFPAVAVESLSRALAEDADWGNRVEAAAGLRRSAVPEAYPPLTEATEDPNEFVRAAAAEGLRELTRAGVPRPAPTEPAHPPAEPAPGERPGSGV